MSSNNFVLQYLFLNNIAFWKKNILFYVVIFIVKTGLIKYFKAKTFKKFNKYEEGMIEEFIKIKYYSYINKRKFSFIKMGLLYMYKIYKKTLFIIYNA